MTDKLQEIRERNASRTQGRWVVGRGAWHRVTVEVEGAAARYPIVDGCLDDNAEFIAHAPEDVSWLIAEVERLRARIERVKVPIDELVEPPELDAGGTHFQCNNCTHIDADLLTQLDEAFYPEKYAWPAPPESELRE